MKYLKVTILMFLMVFVTFSQEFKKVENVQDVVDNYITATGGADALKSVESVKMKGTFGEGSEGGSIEVYFSRKYLYMDLDTKQFKMKQAVDVDAKKGWTKFGTMLKDMKEEEITKQKKNAEGTLWANFLNPKDNGITFELLQNETVNGSDAYVVDQLKDGVSVATSYFDTKTFLKVRELKGSMTNDFSDFRKTGDENIMMPYKINSQQGDVTLTEIKFNSKFDKKLLKKPAEEEDKKQDDK